MPNMILEVPDLHRNDIDIGNCSQYGAGFRQPGIRFSGKKFRVLRPDHARQIPQVAFGELALRILLQLRKDPFSREWFGVWPIVLPRPMQIAGQGVQNLLPKNISPVLLIPQLVRANLDQAFQHIGSMEKMGFQVPNQAVLFRC